MTRKFTFLLMALLALAGFKSWAQEEITIGTGTSTTGYYPFYGLYNYSYSEMLYGAEEIGVAGNITAISFNASNATSKSIDFDLDIYMKNVSRTTHTSNSDWETVSASDKVCHATLSGLATGWITFTLDEPFAYDGTSTLMIAFDNNTGDYSSKSFYKNTSTNHKSLCMYLDGSNIDPSNPAATGASTYFSDDRPNIKIEITTSGCNAPRGLAEASHTSTSVTIGWTGNDAESYDVAYGEASSFNLENPATYTTLNTTSTSAVLSGLTAETEYKCAVRSNCSATEQSAWSIPISVTPSVFHELTVNDGTTTNDHVPIYGNWVDSGTTKSQFIIPASTLISLANTAITDITFYSTISNKNYNANWEIYFAEVNYTTMSSSYVDESTMTKVYTGNMTISDNQLTIHLDNSYFYSGQNLLIGFKQLGVGSYQNTNWYGIAEGSSRGGYGTSHSNYTFLPKTTFTCREATAYDITYAQNLEHGSISGPAKGIADATITLIATPEEGYVLDTWTVTNATTGNPITVVDNQFTMPADNVNVTATFTTAPRYTVNITQPEGATLTITPYEDILEGQEIRVSYSLSDGYRFGEWSIYNASTSERIIPQQKYDNATYTYYYCFNMPNANVNATAIIKKLYTVSFDSEIENGYISVSPTNNVASGDNVYVYSYPEYGFGLGTLTITNTATSESVDYETYSSYYKFLMPEGNAHVTAEFTSLGTLYTVTLPAATEQGSVEASRTSSLAGDEVTLTVHPNANYSLTGITVMTVGENPQEVLVTATGANTYKITMPESNVVVATTYSLIATLTVNDGTATNEQVPFYGWNADSYTKSQFIIPANELEGMADGIITDLTFYVSASSSDKDLTRDSWDIYLAGTNTTEQGTAYVDFETMTKVYSGTLSVKNHQVTIHLDSPYQYDADSENPHLRVGFNQTAKGDYTRTYWLGTAETNQTTAPYYSRASYGSTNASFNFLPKTTFTYSNPNLHGITLNQPEGGVISASAEVAVTGTVVTLTLVQAPLGYEFGAWVVKDAEDNDITVTDNTFEMPASDVTVSATFNEVTQYNITFATLEEGTIHAEYNNATITKAPAGTTVTLVVALNTGYGLDQFIVDGEALDGNTFVMPSHDVEVSATFVPALTVYDGTATQYYAPVYTYYGDAEGSASQFMVPASLLEDMQGGTINSMKFYISSSERLENLETASYKGYIAEIEGSSMSTFIFDDASTPTIFDGTVSLTNNNTEMLITFSEPYTYNGGNLVIAFECTESEGAWTKLNYYSSSATGGIIYRNGSATSANTSNYVPKTTFYYTPGEVTYYDINMHVNGNETVETLRANSTLQAPENIPAGLTFCGWTTADIETYTDVAPAYQTKVTEVTDLYAVFSYSEMGGATTWTKVTDPSELTDGQEIVLVYNNSYVMGERQGQYSMNYYRYAVSVADDKISSLPSSATIFTLEQSSGKWKLHYNDFGTPTTLSYNTNDGLANYGMWLDYGCYSYDEWTAEGTSNVIFRNNYNYEYIGEDESEYAELIHSVSNANLACQAFKKDVALVTYYMTEVLTEGEVADLATKNIIVVNPITVSGRLEMHLNGLFRNENTANFVFEDGAQFYYPGTETVNATFEKEIEGYSSVTDKYYFIANPTDNDEVANLTENDDYDLYYFDSYGDEEGLEWMNMAGEEEISVKHYEDGDGYMSGYLYANSADVTLQFAGNLLPAGDAEFILARAEDGEGIDFPGFNLVGNPYACNLYIDKPAYLLNGNGYEPIQANAAIAPCEGFFVEAAEDGETLSLSTTEPEEPERAMNITVSQNRGEVIDRAYVSFNGTGDLHKLMMNPNRTNIRLAKNGEEFAVLSTDAEGEIPVSFKAEKNGNYTINVNTENVEAQYLHLIDNMTGMDVDLLSTSSYTFNATTSDYAYRFKLVFNMNMDEANGNGDNNFAFMSDGNLVIDNIEGEATLQIVDVLGRVLSAEIVSGSYNKALNLKAGLYILNLNGMTQKIVVK